MSSRTTRSTATFSRPFRISGYEDELPAGRYEVLVDEELLEGLSFEAYRRTGSYLLVSGHGGPPGQTEMRPIDPRDLEAALARDQAETGRPQPSDAALSPQEDPS
jgi:hypothetical protein